MADPEKDAAPWLAAARAGSAEALGHVLETCRNYLLLVAERELDPDLRAKGGASDLVQETFLKAHRHFARFQGDSEAALRAWLRRLLLNNLADFGRLYRETDKRRIGREVGLGADSAVGQPAAGLAAPEPSPSQQAMAHEQAQAVQSALDQLPDDYRQVLELRYHEERSFEEIAQVMGRSTNAIHKLWLRAIKRLQQDVEGAS
jgi:RNA polymerase sigma-70 factor (ECF subfamily)